MGRACPQCLLGVSIVKYHRQARWSSIRTPGCTMHPAETMEHMTKALAWHCPPLQGHTQMAGHGMALQCTACLGSMASQRTP